MNIEKWIALFFLVCFSIYTYLSLTFPLLPFEENLTFKPNTFPTGIGVLGVVLSLLLVSKKSETEDEEQHEEKIYDFRTTSVLVGLMLLYAFLLQPLGFIISTSLFIFLCSFSMGERNYKWLIPISLFSSIVIWFIVQVTLGIYMNSLPAFLGH